MHTAHLLAAGACLDTLRCLLGTVASLAVALDRADCSLGWGKDA